MSTNAVATIYDEFNDEPICAIYKHWDGYPEGGFGDDLREVVSRYKIVNGITYGEEQPIANGMGDLAAFIVKAIKDGPGDVYMVRVGDEQEYTYQVHHKDGVALVTCDQEPDW